MITMIDRATARLQCLRRWRGLLVPLLSLALLPFAAAGEARADEKTEEPEATGVDLLVDPAAEPIPALKYHLLPPIESLRPGNAAPIYLRIVYEQSDEWRRVLREEPHRLLDVPREELPLDEARKVLRILRHATEQMSAATYRDDCIWEYVTEDRDPIMILLPDAQQMRLFARVLALKARYEIQTGNLTAAAGTLQDGLALARHVARAPFLVNQLIGAAIAGLILPEVEALIGHEDSVNLYWALAMLPRPFISFERGLATERQFLEMKFPELADMDRPRTTNDWRRLLRDMRDWAGEVLEIEQGSSAAQQLLKQFAKKPTPEQIEKARAHLVEKLQVPAAKVEAMSQAEVEVGYTVALYDEIIESWQKWVYLPYPQSLPRFGGMVDSLRTEARRRELFPLVSELAPVGANVFKAQARTDRMVARLQAIEALRMHAAATRQLPEKLAAVTIVPVPHDPATGAPFRYTREGDAAVLDLADEVGMSRESLRMPVRIRLRGK